MEGFHFTASAHWRLHLREVDLVEVVVHRLSLPQSVEVDGTAVRYDLDHVGEDLQCVLAVYLADLGTRDEEFSAPEEEVALVET